MCGIAGILNCDLSREELTQRLLKLQACLRHRGPDDQGLFVGRSGQTGLVNTRLRVIDLSPAGHQPMSSSDNRLQIVFNGEIYNYATLRKELEEMGETFSSNSDTEVILKMYQRYGPDCVREFEGMFAFAIWDDVDETCFLARDALGVKPLYYFCHNETFIFASESQSLMASDLIPKKLLASALRGYLLSGAVPEPETLIEGVYALPAGHHLWWRQGSIRTDKYWSVHFEAEPFTERGAIKTVRDSLEESIARHLVSDVPVGVFLSGGIDSTGLLALASQVKKGALQTFCISFDDPEFDEGDMAARTAAHFGTEHFDWRLDSVTARSLLKEFLACSDQPSIDGFNTFCVAKHAHDRGAKVVLSGVGGDELFGGYPSFQSVPQLVKCSRLFNGVASVRRQIGLLVEAGGTSPRMRRFGRFLRERPTTATAYQCMRGIFTPPEVDALLKRYISEETAPSDGLERLQIEFQPTVEDEVSYLELTRYMRNQLLRDSDVMSMAWSLELRVPFVDATLITAISRIPAKFRLARSKELLLNAIPEIPAWVRNHPKRGFAFPFRDWIMGEWKEIFERIESQSPVKLQNWYRQWCLFALENFLERNEMHSRDLARAA